MTLATLYLSGEVNRWHSNPVMAREHQAIADHQGRAAQLLLALNPEASPALVYSVLHHDVGELGAGDLAAPFKRRFPDIARAHAAIEGEMAVEITGRLMPYLLPVEANWLRLVDGLESLLFVLFRRPDEYAREDSGWERAHLDIVQLAEQLGCAPAVEAVVRDIRAGRW